MRKLLALLVCASLAAQGCASSGPPRVNTPAASGDRGLLVDYVKRLPVGSRVKVSLSDGHTLKGTLMQASDSAIVVQRRTRIPEPPDSVAIERIAAVELESGGGAGRSIWIGFAAGAGGAVAVLLVLAALFADD